MRMSIENLISEVEAYAKARSLSPATVISRAVDNGRLYGRLKSGFGCHVDTADRIRRYMASNPPSSEGAT